MSLCQKNNNFGFKVSPFMLVKLILSMFLIFAYVMKHSNNLFFYKNAEPKCKLDLLFNALSLHLKRSLLCSHPFVLALASIILGKP